MCNKTNKLFTIIEKVFGDLANLITFFLMFILNPGHTFQEVKDKHMNVKEDTDIKIENSDKIDPDFFLETTKKSLDAELDRGSVIDEKNKVLLTVAALLMASDAAMVTIISPKWVSILPAIPIISALFLILVHFGVRVIPVPDFKEISKDVNLNNAKINLGKEYLSCESKYSYSNNYFVGVYRASCRAIIIGIILLITAFAFVGNNSENDIIKMLRNNTELMNLLKGPQGPAGMSGSMGPPGPKGEIGPTGPQGPMGKVFIESTEEILGTKKKILRKSLQNNGIKSDGRKTPYLNLMLWTFEHKTKKC